MTVAQFVRAALRLWYVVLLGAVLTLYGLHSVRESSYAYWGKVSVVLLPSRAESNGGNELLSKGPTALAAAAVTEVNHQPAVLTAATTDATLVGMGEKRRTLVQLRNGGGQWVPRAAGPYIDIEAVDTTPELVTDRIDTAVAKVRAAIVKLEADLQVPVILKVSVSQSPEQVTVNVMHSSPSRALAATALAGAGATLGAVIALDRLLGPRRRRRKERRERRRVEPEPEQVLEPTPRTSDPVLPRGTS